MLIELQQCSELQCAWRQCSFTAEVVKVEELPKLLPKDGGVGLPIDMSRRRPEVGEGDGRMRRGRSGWEPDGKLASPGAGEKADNAL